MLTLSVAWQALVQEAPHLYVTALIALAFKAIVIPVALRRIVVKLGIHREIDNVVGVGLAMLAGIGLVALSMVVMLRVTAEADPLAREDLAFALSVVLLGLLMMVTRRNAVSQVIGFMSLENGLVLAATGAMGMPLVVVISVAFGILAFAKVFPIVPLWDVKEGQVLAQEIRVGRRDVPRDSGSFHGRSGTQTRRARRTRYSAVRRRESLYAGAPRAASDARLSRRSLLLISCW